eukprot:7131762-Lingulodinium_polyedra.AAC.1
MATPQGNVLPGLVLPQVDAQADHSKQAQVPEAQMLFGCSSPREPPAQGDSGTLERKGIALEQAVQHCLLMLRGAECHLSHVLAQQW